MGGSRVVPRLGRHTVCVCSQSVDIIEHKEGTMIHIGVGGDGGPARFGITRQESSCVRQRIPDRERTRGDGLHVMLDTMPVVCDFEWALQQARVLWVQVI